MGHGPTGRGRGRRGWREKRTTRWRRGQKRRPSAPSLHTASSSGEERTAPPRARLTPAEGRHSREGDTSAPSQWRVIVTTDSSPAAMATHASIDKTLSTPKTRSEALSVLVRSQRHLCPLHTAPRHRRRRPGTPDMAPPFPIWHATRYTPTGPPQHIAVGFSNGAKKRRRNKIILPCGAQCPTSPLSTESVPRKSEQYRTHQRPVSRPVNTV